MTRKNNSPMQSRKSAPTLVAPDRDEPKFPVTHDQNRQGDSVTFALFTYGCQNTEQGSVPFMFASPALCCHPFFTMNTFATRLNNQCVANIIAVHARTDLGTRILGPDSGFVHGHTLHTRQQPEHVIYGQMLKQSRNFLVRIVRKQ